MRDSRIQIQLINSVKKMKKKSIKLLHTWKKSCRGSPICMRTWIKALRKYLLELNQRTLKEKHNSNSLLKALYKWETKGITSRIYTMKFKKLKSWLKTKARLCQQLMLKWELSISFPKFKNMNPSLSQTKMLSGK